MLRYLVELHVYPSSTQFDLKVKDINDIYLEYRIFRMIDKYHMGLLKVVLNDKLNCMINSNL